jgi:uncharacterized protein involved in response to NO
MKLCLVRFSEYLFLKGGSDNQMSCDVYSALFTRSIMASQHAAPDPYRLFFPLGLILGFAGIAIWPLVHFGLIQGYWGISHAFIQSNGFLFSFIVGFLLTALPRFTGTENPSFASQLLLALCIVVGSITLETQNYEAAQTAFVTAYVVFFILVAQRFIKRDRTPPETFSLIGFGVFAGFLGAVLNAVSSYGFDIGGWAIAGKRLLTEGMTLLLVLGVGGFLGPRLLGFAKLDLIKVEGIASQKREIPFRSIYVVAGTVILLSIIIEHVFGLEWMNYVRVLAATLVILITLQPWKMPLAKTTLAWCVWVSNLLTLAGLWLAAAVPVYRVDMLHVMFIGGFTLLILAVGMRVTLSHGGHGLEPERKNWPLRIALILGSISMLARVGAQFHSASYSAHLVYASVALMIALVIWGLRIMRLLYVKKA